MDSGREMSIGQRIAMYRKARGLTQEGLAMRLNRSKSWVTKVERGERPLDSITTILQVARALSVEVQKLTGRPYFPDPGERDAKSEGLYPLRRVLMRYDAIHNAAHGISDGPPLPIADLRREAERVRQLYNQAPNNFSAVVPFLPTLIGQAQLAARQASEPDRGAAYAVLANLCRLAGLELRQYGDMDLGWIAADRALLAAGQSGNDLLVASCAASMTVQLMVQGQPEEAVGLAMDSAAALHPHVEKNKSPASLAIWGALHLYAAQAAARADDPKESRRLLDVATAAADELGADREEYWLFFGPTNVGIQEAGILVDLTEPAAALRRGAAVDPNRLPSVNRRCYHHLHAARAYGLRRQDRGAVRELLAAEQVAPELVRWDPMARELVRAMLERERRSLNPNLRGLAGRLGMLV
jgi:transcriptional regulator with XRE-family HTH domain